MPRNREDSIKTKIELSGEKEYKKACAQINAEIRELSSEMKLLSSQFDDTKGSTEALTKQQELYTKQLAEQQKKIDAAEKALKDLEDAGDSNTEAARRMRIELNKNKTAYAETEKKVKALADEIEDSQTEYKQYVQAAKNVDDTLEELSSEMKLLTEKTKDSADSAETLRKKHDGLEKVFKEQEKKVSALEKAYAAAAKDGDRLGRESNELKIALNNAKTAAAKTENEMRELERAMDGAGDAADDAEDGFADFGDAIAGLGGPFGEAGDLLGDLADKFGAFGINAGALLNPTTMAVGGLVVALGKGTAAGVEFAAASQDAAVSFANQTGIALEEMEQYKDIMQDIYVSGYGENMEEIANAMSRAAQATGDFDPQNLQDMAKGALTLSETFDIDMAESIRGANMLMNTFGVDGARAFDMIALAAQLGLNQNDNLLDTINEYATHYQQLGLSVEDMFDSLANAQESGVFDIDKVGDAMKEFGIRVREGGDEVRDVFEDMGLNADDMVNAFNTGGEAAAGALDQVLDALFAIEDETLKNQMGVALFGTMWEDLGKTGIEAATNFDAALQNASGTLDQINNQRFDTLNGQWEILCRNAQTAFEPLGTFLTDMLTDALKGVNDWLEKWNTGQTVPQKLMQDAENNTGYLEESIMDLGDKLTGESRDKRAERGTKFMNWLFGVEPDTLTNKQEEIVKQTSAKFDVPITFTTDEKSYAEQLGIISELDTEPLILAGKRQGAEFDAGIKIGMEEGAPDVLGTAEELGWSASDSVAQAYPGFEESGAWVIKGTETGMASGEASLQSKAGEIAKGASNIFWHEDQTMRAAGVSWMENAASGFESMEGTLQSRLQAVIDRVVSQISATVQISAVVGATAAVGGQNFSITQNIYANETSYVDQQKAASKSFLSAVRNTLK